MSQQRDFLRTLHNQQILKYKLMKTQTTSETGTMDLNLPPNTMAQSLIQTLVDNYTNLIFLYFRRQSVSPQSQINL